MGEGPELPPEQPEDEVLGGDKQTRDGVARRITEHEQTPSVLRRRSQQSLVVRVTADHPMQHDDVGYLDALRIDGDVVQAPLRTLLEPCLTQERLRLLLVGR